MTALPVPQAFVLVWCPADGRVVPCEAYVADQNGRAIGGEDEESTANTAAAYAAGRPILTYEGYKTEQEAEAAARRAGGGRYSPDYQVRPLPVGSFFYADDVLCVVGAAPRQIIFDFVATQRREPVMTPGHYVIYLPPSTGPSACIWLIPGTEKQEA